jgi:hypothetical protein
MSMRFPSPLAWSIDLALNLDVAADPIGRRPEGVQLQLLPALPSSDSGGSQVER